MANEEDIRDIPTIKKMCQDLDNLKAIKEAMPVLSPCLTKLGSDPDQIHKPLAKIEQLEPLIKEMASIPDRFNDTHIFDASRKLFIII